MTRRSFAALAAGALLLPLAAGCGESQADVSGEVLIDGRPLPEGEIIFESTDGKAPAGAPIKAGRYEVKVAPGPKKVRITASRPPKKRDPVLGDAAREPSIGEEFNVKTRLTAEIKSGANEGVNFEVKELPK
jgi:hypothetical protein